jgi:AcrR family transcriptional regulator
MTAQAGRAPKGAEQADVHQGAGAGKPQHRDAKRSRDRLFEAARDLFGERGFERTTTRDIAERAGVDSALIARYFGSKTELYIQTLDHGSAEQPADLLQPGRLESLLIRADHLGSGPLLHSVIQVHADDRAQSAARLAVENRLVAPLEQRFIAQGLGRPRLRAQLAIAAFAGIVQARHAGSLDQVSEADTSAILELLQAMLAAVSGEPAQRP